jgi:uncharacterized membrane protein (UPF0127 family)
LYLFLSCGKVELAKTELSIVRKEGSTVTVRAEIARLSSVSSTISVRYAMEVPQGWFVAQGITSGDSIVMNKEIFYG